MGKIKRYGSMIERFITSESGQRFFNFAYSIGAAIVIWGALFKLLYIRGGETLLAIGMGTEVVMFILAAFDRPPGTYRPIEAETDITGRQRSDDEALKQKKVSETAAHFVPVLKEYSDAIAFENEALKVETVNHSEQLQALNRNLSGLNAIYEGHFKSISGQLEAIERVNEGLKEIRETYEKTASQSTRYMEETEKLTKNIEQLNAIYEKMLNAMTVGARQNLNQ